MSGSPSPPGRAAAAVARQAAAADPGGWEFIPAPSAAAASAAVTRQRAYGALAGGPAVFALVVLLLIAVSGTAAMLLSTSCAYGATIGTVVLLTIGAASGGQLPAPFLPSWMATGAYVLPNGLAINGLRAVVYFHGPSAGTAFLGLALWAVVPVALIELASRLHRRPGRAESKPVATFPNSMGSGGNTA